MALLKVMMRPDGVVDVRGTQDVVAALRSGGEEQRIDATERPLPHLPHLPPSPLPVAGRRGGGGRDSGEAEGLHHQ